MADQWLGRIPLRIRVGVTGHRWIADSPALRGTLEHVFAVIRERVPVKQSTQLEITIVSALAEGADRIVATVGLQVQSAHLEVLLPLLEADYRRDFKTPESVAEFTALLQRAELVIPAPRSDVDTDPYEAVGDYIADQSDVLIALWDGSEERGKGGTGAVVELARARGLPLFWINASDPQHVVEENAQTVAQNVAIEADQYNRAGLTTRMVPEDCAAEAQEVFGVSPDDFHNLSLATHSEWILPFFLRADVLANRYRKRYVRGTLGIVVAAALGVLAAAVHAVAWHEAEALLYVEAILLCVAAGLFLWGRATHVQGRWTSYRFLAELFRSSYFLALAGLHDEMAYGFSGHDESASHQEWIARAFTAVWAQQPERVVTNQEAAALGRFLADVWLGEDNQGQVAYFRRRSARLRILDTRASLALMGTFVFAIVVAVLHPLAAESYRTALALGSLILPVTAAAIAALASDREFRRHAARYSLMAAQLSELRTRLRSVATADRLRELAHEAEQIMLQESRDWFEVRRFHDFEPLL